MSIASAIVARAYSHPGLYALIGGRIFRQGAIQGTRLPYVVFHLGAQSPDLTYGGGPSLTITRVDANLYARAFDLEDLETQWRGAFEKYQGTHGGAIFKSWISSAYDEPIESRFTDPAVRTFCRVLETTVALEPA